MTAPNVKDLRQAGFTLIEAVIVIVVIGVLGAIVALFIRMPLQGYQDSVARAELTDLADLTVRRVARDLRLALPNSIIVAADGSTISFFITKTGGRYLVAEDEVPGFKDFLAGGDEVDFAGPRPAGKQEILPGDSFVVNNLGVAPADAYASTNLAQIEAISVIDDTNFHQYRLKLESNPFATQIPPMPSAGSRFHIVGPPVSYRCNAAAGGAGSMTRQWDYGIVRGAPAANAGTISVMTRRVSNCSFSYGDSAGRSALVTIRLELEVPEGGTVKLVHQVHVDNTP
ncbi:prepilin-type N-terminal cleavage/methylation domain-containing protein [Massilia cavernae]|uniref:Prepilin-type N-terminal cleavage/methylation domain-containing protein n=1 Tax=Massilia cavernae TaxID=2320864 RepID=A0A418Y7B2_9BURK|nr:prepilin-type N-terminal cleavage/methylation domain-containing protein [Massilia cavernae]RJG25823.1 prepilin-type N-terminal cleavage/methylation domain-containing protein [Massilia cavernae]